MNINGKIDGCMPRIITPFTKFLEERFLEWERVEGTRKALFEFANHLGVNRPTLSQWMNGKRAPQDREVIDRLAFKLGNEIYDALHVPRPDSEYTYINYHWKELSDEEKRLVTEQIKRFLADHAGE